MNKIEKAINTNQTPDEMRTQLDLAKNEHRKLSKKTPKVFEKMEQVERDKLRVGSCLSQFSGFIWTL